ncbi:MAG TPA: multiheme c-type cytochrome [Blastocatellia bacterium]|nr:multiheme c-type cytochrome [Blastocatellia bacterium]
MKAHTLAKLVALVIVIIGFKLMTAFGAAAQQLDPAAWGNNHVGKPAPELYGGDECLFCHRATVGAVWQNDPHFRAIRDKFQGGHLAPEIEALGAQPAFKQAASQVNFVLGHHRAERFLQRSDRGSFDLLNATLINPKAPRFDSRSRAEWDAQKFAAKCIGCHMTGVDPVSLRPFETFVGCEACHGPYDDRHTGGTIFMRFAKKAKETPQMVASACGSCHLRGGQSRSTGRPFANNFVAGDNLFKDFAFDFSKADDPSLNSMDAHIQRNVRDIVLLGRDNLTCLSCHKLHSTGSTLHRRQPKTDYCYVCHKTEPFKELKADEVHSATCEY